MWPRLSEMQQRPACQWAQLYNTADELRQAVAGFVDRYDTSWLVQRHGHQTPKGPIRQRKVSSGMIKYTDNLSKEPGAVQDLPEVSRP
jgi:hypothetical protein